MIDLSKFVGKRVLVNLRCGFEFTGFILPPDSLGTYMFAKDGGMIPRVRYTKDGGYDDIGRMSGQGANDIIHIEEIKPMNKYEELEKQVAEMQKEIDRLKKEETKVPEIKKIEVTRTVIYVPDAYLQYCEESGVTPTQEGFIDYIADEFDDDFSNEYYGHQEVKVIED